MPALPFHRLLAAGWVACALPLFGVTLRQMTLDQVAAASTEIVRGTVTQSYIAQSGKTIFTHYVVQVAERWKGSGGRNVDVALPGGALDGVHQTYPGVPTMVQGQSYVLYLWTGSSGPTQPVGLIQGIFNVTSDESGHTMVTRRASGEMMIDAAGKPVSDAPVDLRLQVMRSRVDAMFRGPRK